MGRALLSCLLADLVHIIERIIIASQTKHSMVKSLQRVRSILLTLDAVVDSAEEKQFGGGSNAQAVKDWLNEVQDALYQLDELLPQILTTISSPDLHPLQKFKAQILDTLKNIESLVEKIDVLGLTVEPASKRWRKSSGGLDSITSLVLDNYPKDAFFGRDAEVESILAYLLSTTTEGEQHMKVINIVGLPGVGKTTLTNVLFSNHKVIDSFEITAKLSVPYRATAYWMVKNILEAVNGKFYDGYDFHLLCKRLEETYGGKKCLLVLDDINIEDSDNWCELIALFETGAARGSAIIQTFTSHDDRTLFIIPATLTVRLDLLSIEDWLSIFMVHASRQANNVHELPKEQSAVGEKIVSKLGALPLAAKMTGSLLQDRLDLNPQWDNILNEFLDDVNLVSIALDAGDGDANLPIPSFLVLCYLDLPAPVKRCFASLSLFPKSYHFRQDEVISQWIAHGFLKNNESDKSMEEIGYACFGYLIKRSFLQPVFGYYDRFMMHDLVHDLAIYVFGQAYKLYFCFHGRMKDFEIKKGRSLRTIIPLKGLYNSSLENVAHAKDASDAKLQEKGRLIDLISYNWNGNDMKVFKNLEELQSFSRFEADNYACPRLPDWMGGSAFSSVDTLYLYDCGNCWSWLILGLLPNLRELFIGRSTKISSIGPEFYGEMTALQKPFQSLNVLRFEDMPQWKEWNIVQGVEFPELINLSIIWCPNLVGDLPRQLPSLMKLEIIGCTSLVASLPNVPGTCKVVVYSSYSQLYLDLYTDTVSQEVLEITPESNSEVEEIPHESLMETKSVVSRSPPGSSADTTRSPKPNETSSVVHSLQVEAETGSQSSMAKADNPIITQAAVVPPTSTPSTAPHSKAETLFNAEGDQRSSFEVLKVSTISELKSLPPMLHTLKIEGCESLEAIPNDLLAGLTALKELYLISCGSLTSLPSLGSLTALYIRDCRRLENLSSSESRMQLAFLHHLSIGSSCDSVTTLHLNFFRQLKTLCIWDCPNLLSFHFSGEPRCDLTSLESLEIRDCPKLKSFPEEGLHAPSLVSLLLSNCESLEKLPNAMDSLISLKSLFLHRCPQIESFPPGGLPLSLVFLSIASCDKLRPRKDWGLHNLKSLNRFELEGGCISMESFPEENFLPLNIDSLSLSMLKDLKKLDNKGFQHLNSLRSLEIHCCEMLQSLSDEGLPSSLEHLCVQECSLLTPTFKSLTEAELHKLAHIQHIQIDGQVLY